jgi:hypothetical protein
MMLRGHIYIGAVALVIAASGNDARAAEPHLQANVVSCIPIRTAAQLQAIRKDLTANYCLENDIDLASIANFIPIGDDPAPFTGSLFGNNHVIRNLTIDDSTHIFIGLFGLIVDSTVRDVNLVNVNIHATANDAIVGGLVGGTSINTGSHVISDVAVSGRVRCGIAVSDCGGIAGFSTYALARLSSSADVSGGVFAGGLVGLNGGQINDSFATGNVRSNVGNADVGGLVGDSFAGGILRSFATGTVIGGAAASVGGLVGGSAAPIKQSFASGMVEGGMGSTVGGLVGANGFAASIDQSLSVGFVSRADAASVGGLVGASFLAPIPTNSYWDLGTSDVPSSAGGLGLTTAQLHGGLPAGFDPNVWAISKGVSYPFLNDADLAFTPALATSVHSGQVIFTFLPIGQRDVSQYQGKPVHTANASLAAVYAMVARAIGNTLAGGGLKNAKIDTPFWHDKTQTAVFSGPITKQAKLGTFKSVGSAAKLDLIAPQLKAGHAVILRGHYIQANGSTGTHWMLATLYTKNAKGTVAAIVANDPWTGQQIAIDPTTKRVLTDFPLKNFIVDGYRTVTILLPA